MVLAAVVLVAAIFIPHLVLLPLAAFPELVASLNDPQSPTLGVLITVLQRVATLVLAVLGTWWLVTRLDRRTLRDTGWTWTRDSAALLGVGVAISAVVVIGTQLLVPQERSLGIPPGPLGAVLVIFVANAILLQGIPEELLFRGYLMQTMRSRPVVALMATTLFFGVIHLISSGGQAGAAERLNYLATPTAFGFAAAALLLLTRSLWPAVGIHAGFHLATIVAALLDLSSTGPAVWAVGGLGYAIAGTVALLLWLRQDGPRTPIVIDR